MILTTSDQLGHARRHSQTVIVYAVIDGVKRLDGYGILYDFDEDTVSVMSPSVGLLHFFRGKVVVQLVEMPKE